MRRYVVLGKLQDLAFKKISVLVSLWPERKKPNLKLRDYPPPVLVWGRGTRLLSIADDKETKEALMPEKELFFHSACCGAHWDLVWRDGHYTLECESCGKPAGPFKVTGPDATECECAFCKGEGSDSLDNGN